MALGQEAACLLGAARTERSALLDVSFSWYVDRALSDGESVRQQTPRDPRPASCKWSLVLRRPVAARV